MKTFIINENLNMVMNLVGRVCADLNMNPNTTIGDFRLAVDGGKKADGTSWPTSFLQCVIYAKKGEKLSAKIIDMVKKGKLVSVTGHLENDNYEKDGNKVYNNRIIVTDIVESSPYTAMFSGKVLGNIFFDEKGRANFLLSGYAGKKADGTYRESPVVRVQTVRAADANLVKQGAALAVYGYIKTFESDKNGKRNVVVIDAFRVEEPRQLELSYDDDNNFVSVQPVEDMPAS